jgi:N-dimethylarginine dimethylaminohydrolase
MLLAPNMEDSVVLVVSGQRFPPVSKALLVARSDFFAAMFSTPMKERDAREVEIGEVESAKLFADFLAVLAGHVLPNRIKKN